MDSLRKCSVPLADSVILPVTLYAEGTNTGNSGELGDIFTVFSLNCTFAGTKKSSNINFYEFYESHRTEYFTGFRLPDSALSVYWPAFMLSNTYFPFLSVTATSFCDKNTFAPGKGLPFLELRTSPPTVKPVTLKSCVRSTLLWLTLNDSSCG